MGMTLLAERDFLATDWSSFERVVVTREASSVLACFPPCVRDLGIDPLQVLRTDWRAAIAHRVGLTSDPRSASIADLLAASARGGGLGCWSMLIDLAKVRESEQPLAVEADFDERALRITEDSLARLEGPAHARLTVTVRGDAVRVTGRVQAELRVVCCRCASTFERPLEKAFDLDYAPDPTVKPDGEEVALSYSDLGVGFYHNDELDLRNVVAEQIFLDVPMKPLCREDCHGLCDQCGADLNQGECGCERKSSDPRLAPLLDLKRRMNERD